jgi:hypothetical protein
LFYIFDYHIIIFNYKFYYGLTEAEQSPFPVIYISAIAGPVVSVEVYTNGPSVVTSHAPILASSKPVADSSKLESIIEVVKPISNLVSSSHESPLAFAVTFHLFSNAVEISYAPKSIPFVSAAGLYVNAHIVVHSVLLQFSQCFGSLGIVSIYVLTLIVAHDKNQLD